MRIAKRIALLQKVPTVLRIKGQYCKWINEHITEDARKTILLRMRKARTIKRAILQALTREDTTILQIQTASIQDLFHDTCDSGSDG